MAKRLSLPSRVPFGVSEGNFMIGVAKTASQVKTISRSRLVEELGLGDRPDRSREEEDRVSDRKSETANEEQVPGIAKAGRTPSGSGNKTMKLMSASPVGNYYLYSFDGKLLQTYNVYGVLLKDYIYMGDRLIAEYDHIGARFLYYTPDQINSTRVVTDQGGNVVYSATYNPYGGVQIPDQYNNIDPLPKFSGKERDAESELDYFGARYYDRSQYRFISADPKMYLATALMPPKKWHFYSYCSNNPVAYIDPNGAAEIYFQLNIYYVSSEAIWEISGHQTRGGALKWTMTVESDIGKVNGEGRFCATISLPINVYIPEAGDSIYGTPDNPKDINDSLNHELSHLENVLSFFENTIEVAETFEANKIDNKIDAKMTKLLFTFFVKLLGANCGFLNVIIDNTPAPNWDK
ncbi:MAG: RHS repeat-associated core domain-containing protein [Candidatus Aminicenantes bacterium]|nr:RHS repeat-associated core domain-containing protein [Candidatus Aminicenantes bacterium]